MSNMDELKVSFKALHDQKVAYSEKVGECDQWRRLAEHRADKLSELEAERDRLRDAVEEVLSANRVGLESCTGNLCPNCERVLRSALEGADDE